MKLPFAALVIVAAWLGAAAWAQGAFLGAEPGGGARQGNGTNRSASELPARPRCDDAIGEFRCFRRLP